MSPAHVPHVARSDRYLATPATFSFITMRARLPATGTPSPQTPFTWTPLADVVIAALRSCESRHDLRLYALALLPDHLHFLAAPAPHRLSVRRIVGLFEGETVRAAQQLGLCGRLWLRNTSEQATSDREEARRLKSYILAKASRHGLAHLSYCEDIMPVEW